MRSVGKPAWYRTRIGSLHTESSQRTSRWSTASMPVVEQLTIRLCGSKFLNGYINTMLMNSFGSHPEHRRSMFHAWGYAQRQYSSPPAWDNSRAVRERVNASWAPRRGQCAESLLPDRLTSVNVVMFWKPFCRNCLKMCCGFKITELRIIVGKMSGSGWKGHSQEDRPWFISIMEGLIANLILHCELRLYSGASSLNVLS
jgi:hypothetical protein